jgi:uncharacterized protein (DUF1499 family)
MQCSPFWLVPLRFFTVFPTWYFHRMQASDTGTPTALPLSRAAVAGFWIGLFACVLLMIDGPFYRMHIWGLFFGLRIVFPSVLVLGIIAVLLSLSGFGRPGSRGVAIAALTLGWIAALLPALNLYIGAHSPIHDVSTDTVNPPQFAAVLPLRAADNATNPTAYDSKTAQLQKATYPDIGPLHLDAQPDQVFTRALSAARAMGWEIVATEPTQGRIEATATSFWFGFKDDIVVRITAEGSGSRVDVRSLSRTGQNDVGANARHIRDFLARIRGPRFTRDRR